MHFCIILSFLQYHHQWQVVAGALVVARSYVGALGLLAAVLIIVLY